MGMFEWISAAGLAVSLITSGIALWRSSRRENASDLDNRIDERIDLKLAPDIAVIKNTMAAIQASIGAQPTLVKSTVDATANAINEAARVMLEIRDH